VAFDDLIKQNWLQFFQENRSDHAADEELESIADGRRRYMPHLMLNSLEPQPGLVS